MPEQAGKPRAVIVGAGFGGLYAARTLAAYPVKVTVVDRKNHHTFQPLLYQVATAALSPGDIAYPIRRVTRRRKNVEVLLGEVAGFDLAQRNVRLKDGPQIPYDYLIVAAGARHSYFGHPEWEAVAPGLKTIEDALEIRRRVLLAFELAERRAATGAAPGEINFFIVGAGPTGVELAGALAEIARQVVAPDFRFIDTRKAKVILLEGGPRVLPSYPEELSRRGEQQLRRLGVEVRTSAMVTGVEPGAIRVGDQRLPATVVLWAAGVAASPLGAMLAPHEAQTGLPGGPGEARRDRAGRVYVHPDLSLPGHREVFVIGDLAAFEQDGELLPGVAQVAIQQGIAVARNIGGEILGRRRKPFRYRDKGALATIGRAAAVADFGRLRLSGLLAWLAWLIVHIFFLIGFRNRFLVLFGWAWSYLTFERGARLITGEGSQ